MNENKIKGAIFGLACGDAVGMPFEFKSKKRINEFIDENGIGLYRTDRGGVDQTGFYTDDTAMMLCLATSLLEKGFDTQDQFNRYKKWAFEGYMAADNKTAYGIGQNTLDRLFYQKEIPTEINHNPRAGGNGALMRCLPISLLYYQNIAELVDKSIKSALVTHNNSVAAWGCVVFNVLIVYILKDLPKASLISRLTKEDFYLKLPPELIQMIDNIPITDISDLKTKGYTLYTLQIALYCFLNTSSYQEAIEMSIRLGGDTDTQAAVTGGLAGAYYGFESIPEDWVKLMNLNKIEEITQNLININL